MSEVWGVGTPGFLEAACMLLGREEQFYIFIEPGSFLSRATLPLTKNPAQLI